MPHKLLALLLFCANFCHAQNTIPQFDIHKKISYFIALEEKSGSTIFANQTQELGLGDKAQPLIYQIKQKDIPDVLVYYYFSKKDSLVSQILYEWDVYNFDKKNDNKKTPEFNKKLISKYLDLYKVIAKKYGESTMEGSLDDLSKINQSDGLKRKDIWNNDSLNITMYTSISDFYMKKGGVTVNPTHRIRLYIKYKGGSTPVGKPNEEHVLAADKNYTAFVSNLAKDNFDAAKQLISKKTIGEITPEILTQIKKTLVTGRETKIYMSGVQIMQDGNNHLMIQYKYSDDKAAPPIEIIKVIFDSDNTIISMQPMKRS